MVQVAWFWEILRVAAAHGAVNVRVFGSVARGEDVDHSECAGRIEDYIQEGEAQFMRDTKTQDAVIRNFEVIGDAAKRLPDTFREKHPSVPWGLLAGFRDVLIHQYDGVDLQRVWIIATRDLPAVKRGVAAILPPLDQIEREIAGEK